MQTLSILGLGAFGQFAAKHLAPHFSLLAFDREDRSAAARDVGARWATLADAARADILVLAVPVQTLGSLLTDLSPLLAARPTPPLVLDVASVKLKPLALLQAALPGTPIVGLHPCFGPQSGKDGISNLPIALCNATAPAATLACVREFLAATLQLRVIEITPDEHDRQMAYVQGLTHLITRAIGELDLPDTPLATAAYQRFLSMRDNLRFDSWDLFLTIARENPYAAEVRHLFQAKLSDLDQRAKGG